MKYDSEEEISMSKKSAANSLLSKQKKRLEFKRKQQTSTAQKNIVQTNLTDE